MLYGIQNKLTAKLSDRAKLLLIQYSNRSPRAKSMHKALALDIKMSSHSFENAKSCMKGAGVQVEGIPDRFWTELALVLQDKKHSEKLGNCLNNISDDTLSPGEWLELSMYLVSFGLFHESLICRVKSYSSIESNQWKWYYGINYPILEASMLFDKGDWEEAGKIIKAKSLLHRKNPYYRYFFYGDRNVGNEIDDDYKKLIEGKNIAVIGPLAFEQDYSDEIAQADIVVELNALKSKRDKVKEKYHGNPDIVYYNNSCNDNNSKSGFKDVIGTKFLVIKNDKYLEELTRITKTRVAPQASSLPWNGSFSMMEITLSDLLLFNPKSVKVFGVDLYTSFNYDKSYGNKPPQNLARITLNFTVHDVFTQFSFLNNLYKRGYIVPDERLKHIVELNINEYAGKLSELYPIYLDDSTVNIDN